MPTTRENPEGGLDYWLGKYWVDESDVCHSCLEKRTAEGKDPVEAEPQYSMGIYAGKRCDTCHKRMYRDADFDPMDAGEAYWEDEY